MTKHGKAPSVLVVRGDEYAEWMRTLGIDIKQVDKNLAPNHFMLLIPSSPEEAQRETLVL